MLFRSHRPAGGGRGFARGRAQESDAADYIDGPALDRPPLLEAACTDDLTALFNMEEHDKSGTVVNFSGYEEDDALFIRPVADAQLNACSMSLSLAERMAEWTSQVQKARGVATRHIMDQIALLVLDESSVAKTSEPAARPRSSASLPCSSRRASRSLPCRWPTRTTPRTCRARRTTL